MSLTWGRLLIAGISAGAAHGAIVAGPVVNPDNNHTYFLLSPTSWTRAQEQARSLGGNLATINDANECVWIVENFVFYAGAPTPIWIGLTDQDSEGVFRWISGESPFFRNWHAGEPNNDAGLGTPENFVFIFPGPRFRGNWKDANAQATSDLETDPGRWTTGPDGDIGCYGLVEVNALPAPMTLTISKAGQAGVITWKSSPGLTYQVYEASGFFPEVWTAAGGPVIATGETTSITRALNQTARMFRVFQLL